MGVSGCRSSCSWDVSGSSLMMPYDCGMLIFNSTDSCLETLELLIRLESNCDSCDVLISDIFYKFYED